MTKRGTSHNPGNDNSRSKRSDASRGVDQAWKLLEPGTYFNEIEKALDRFEPGWALASLSLRGGLRFGPDLSLRCMSMPQVSQRLSVFQRRFEGGSRLALLDAVRFCAEEGVPLPKWLADEFIATYDEFLRPGGSTTLDKVFCEIGRTGLTPKKAAKQRLDTELGCLLLFAAWRVAMENDGVSSLDGVIKEVLRIGFLGNGSKPPKDWGIGETKAKELIEMQDKNQMEFSGRSQSLSEFLAKRRKR